MGLPTVMIDIPEIVLRLQIGNDYTLDELNKIFNDIANKIRRGEVTPDTSLAAQILYPEVFLKPREAYMQRILQEIASS